jgi:catechol 2,3-dioxygenase
MKAFLPDHTRLAQVHLRTGDLPHALAFYSQVLGLKAKSISGASVSLSTPANGAELIVLTEQPDAPRNLPPSTGLYHFALRYPAREALGQAGQQLIQRGYPIAGASDHGVSEAIYLNDADGNGVELYVDRPRVEWPWRDGRIAMVTQPLDLDALLDSVSETGTGAAPAPVEIGHIHLHVADLAAAERFYGDYLGFSVTERSCSGALFFAAGGYHHHIGVNTWAGRAAPPAGSVGLVSYRLEVPCAEILYCLRHRAPLMGYEISSGPRQEGASCLQIRDPNGTWLEIQPSPPAISWEADPTRCAARAAAPLSPASQGTTPLHQERKMSYELKSHP